MTTVAKVAKEYISGFHPINVFRIWFTCPVPSYR
jgi:hypothetical protein